MVSRFGKAFLRSACVGAAVAVSLVCGSAANAAQVLISNGQMTNPLIVHLSGAAYNGDVYDAPMQFTTTYNGVPNVELLAFCVDVFHDINFGPYSTPLQYVDTVPFTTNSRPSPGASDQLLPTTIEQIAKLVNYGTDVFHDGALSGADKRFTLAAVQGAIWQVVAGEDVTLATGGYSQNSGVNATNFNSLVDNFSDPTHYQDFFAGNYGAIGDQTKFITPLNYPDPTHGALGTQSFMFAVPEPGTWAMMLLGFGLIGAALRHRRRARSLTGLAAAG